MTEYEMTPAQKTLQEQRIDAAENEKAWKEIKNLIDERLKEEYSGLIEEETRALQETDLLSVKANLGLLTMTVARTRSLDQGEAAACAAAEPERSGAFLTFQWKLISAAAYKAALRSPILGQWAFRVVDHSAPKASFSPK